MKTFSTRLPDEIIQWLKIQAAKQGKQLQEFVLELMKKAKGDK
jgi:predicted DNA binding CopG/RHH family protein